VSQRALAEAHPVQGNLRAIQAAAERAGTLVQQILLFSRRQEAPKEEVDLVDRVRNAVELLQATFPPGIDLALDLPPEPLIALANQSQVDQVLVNLMTNGLHAMRGQAGVLRIAVGTSTDGKATLSVADSGTGMDSLTQRRVFEPFFTTKAPGQGSGLGLAIVHGIARDHGGDVTVVSAPGLGSTFTLELPRSTVPLELPEAEAEPSRDESPPRRTLRVLCVDDQAGVATVACAVLASAGHEPQAELSPLDALARLAAAPFAFDVLLTDQSMPELTGVELIVAARALRPDLPCVLMTGLGDDSTVEAARLMGVEPVLAKPFTGRALLGAIELAVRCGETAR
jgi:two-component system, cell cycle sensor histidine kinase and response regulator CckA